MWIRIALIGAAVAVVLVAVFVVGERLGHSRAPQVAQTAGTPAKNKDSLSEIRIDFGGKAKGSDATAGLIGNSLMNAFDGTITTLAARPILFVDGEANVSSGSATPALQASYAKIRAFMAARHLTPAGPPIAINEDFDTVRRVWRYRAGIPLSAAPQTSPAGSDGIVLAATYAGTVVRFVHQGDPNQAEATYAKIDAWMKSKGLSASGPTWEEYTSDPQTPVSKQRTNIYVPIG